MRKAEELDVVGADANNLRDIDCAFPRRGLSAVVGVSGSGKSSLLQDTIAAEVLRRNTLFHGLHKQVSGDNTVGAYVGASPLALFVGQRAFRASSRTTVGTATGLLGDLRSLFLAEGGPESDAGRIVPRPSPDTYADWLINHYRGAATIWTIPLRWLKTDGVTAAQKLAHAGFTSAILRSTTDDAKLHEAGRLVDPRKWTPLPSDRAYNLEAEVGSLDVTGPAVREQLLDVLNEAWDLSGADVIVELHDAPDDLSPTRRGQMLDGARHYVDPASRAVFRAPDSHLLSFNAPEHEDTGACPTCKGLGRAVDVVLDALVTAPQESMHGGAFALWTPKNYKHVNIQHEIIEGLRGREGFDPDRPWQDLPKQAQALILSGLGNEKIQGIDPKSGKKQGSPRPFPGFRHAILAKLGSKTPPAALEDFIHEGPCPACGGSRWSWQASALTAAGVRLAEWLDMPMTVLTVEARHAASRARKAGGREALQRIADRAEMLNRLGLGHLSAARGMNTVSDGESRRLQIGATLAARGEDLLLLLDEPARGLHETDLHPMIGVLRKLAERHCVLLNEHRAPVIAAADHVVALGPGAGPEGGAIVPFETASIRRHNAPNKPEGIGRDGWLGIYGASVHTVRNQDVRLPLGRVTAIVGVSGSGKSSFVRGVLIPALLNECAIEGDAPSSDDLLKGHWRNAEGLDAVRKVHVLHQRMPQRNRRSLVATATGVFETIAERFADTDEARKAGFGTKDFSINAGSARCPTCKGTGTANDEADTPCPACGGRRYREAALAPRVAGLSIAETLARPVRTLRETWLLNGAMPLASDLAPLFETMEELGLGHIALGRRVDSLSGGEMQRLRVARSLAGRDDHGGQLFILDEPAAGLHRDDAHRLMDVLRRMVDGGRNTVVVIEHNMHVVRAVDWLVEFGPGAGPAGGRVIAEGTPAQVAERETPTGSALSRDGNPANAEVLRLDTASPDAPLNITAIIDGDLDREDASKEANQDPVRRMLKGRRIWEIGDLNLEVGKLLLDEHARRVDEERGVFLKSWIEKPDLMLAINPAIPDMRIWGPTLPRSAAKALIERLPHMGLSGLRADAVQDACLRPASLRIALPPVGREAEERAAMLNHALAIGGGMAELRTADDKVVARLAVTPLDLQRGLVGPQSLSLPHLSRLRAEGRCDACGGSGAVDGTRESLLLRPLGQSAKEIEDVLTPEAAELFKGLWRSEARPFFRRLEEEGLADHERLPQDLLFGFWRRPGHGTFLKSAKEKPEEVASWLKWNGLFSHLWSELPRSKRKDWAEKVRKERQPVPCPSCDGTGHGIVFRLMTLNDKPLVEWVRTGTVGDLLKAIDGMPTHRNRQAMTRSRLVACLQAAKPNTPLGAPCEATGGAAHALGEVVRHAFLHASFAR